MEVIPKYFSDFAEAMNRRFDGVDEKLDVIATTVLRHDEILQRHDGMLQQIVSTLSRHSEQLAEHSMMLRVLTGSHDNHEERISHLERSVTRLRLKVDN